MRHGWLALTAAADDQLAHWFGVDPAPSPVWLPPADTVAAVIADPLRWFDEEHDALMTAVRGCGPVAWAIAQRMATYQELRGRYEDWCTVLRAGLAAADASHDKQGQATMLGLLMHAEATRDEHQAGMRYAALAFAAYQALDTPPPPCTRATTATTPALEDARRRGDVLAIGFEACRLTISLRVQGTEADYLALFEEARDAFRLGNVPLLELWTIKNAGLGYLRQHRFTEAVECLGRGQAIFQAATGEVVPGGDLASVAAAHDRPDLAEQLAKASLTDANRMGDAWSAARALHALADVRASRGDPAAARTYRKALTVWTDLRMPRRVAQVEEAMARLG